MVGIAFVYVGIGGLLGSCLRYLFSLVFRGANTMFPVSTLVSNVTAALAIGIITGLERQAGLITPSMRLFLVTGILGGLGTISTFCLETLDLYYAGRYAACALDVFLNLFLSFSGVLIGMALVRNVILNA